MDKKADLIKKFRDELDLWGHDTSEYTDEDIEASMLVFIKFMRDNEASISEAHIALVKMGQDGVAASKAAESLREALLKEDAG